MIAPLVHPEAGVDLNYLSAHDHRHKKIAIATGGAPMAVHGHPQAETGAPDLLEWRLSSNG
ncbi:hypothetical protein [Rhodoblastus sp.]|uniref:hypothetical protein n=1 Tax=Rhodoblastus sp. TaxID=1962975 RepID=UPI003F95E186